MKYFFLAFVALTLAVDAAIAIECYTCGYLEGGGPTEQLEKFEIFDKSCRSGKKPNKKFSDDCGAAGDLCGKIVVESGDLKGTLRGCFPSQMLVGPGLDAEKCYDKTGKDLNDLIPDTGFDFDIPEEASVTMCSCKEDKCNSSSMLKVTQASLMVLVIGFLTSKFMY